MISSKLEACNNTSAPKATNKCTPIRIDHDAAKPTAPSRAPRIDIITALACQNQLA